MEVLFRKYLFFRSTEQSVSNESRHKIRKVFKEVDINDDRLIDWSEIQKCCEKLQMKLNEEDRAIFDHCDIDNNGGLDIDEFVDFIHIRLKRVFDEIDTDNSGELDDEEIKAVLKKLGIEMSQRQINGILKDMDEDGNGKIDFKEFCDFFSDVPTLNLQTMASKWMYGEGLDVGADVVPSLPPAEIPLVQFMVAGALGGVASRTAVAPLEKIKILAQTATAGSNTKIKHTFLKILRNEGLRGLFGGNLANCLRVAPTGAIVGLIYSRMLKYTPVDNVNNPNQPIWRLFAGATAGVVSATATHPLDVVRARLTVQDLSIKGTQNYSGIFNTFKRIHVEEGFKGLYKGLSPAVQSVAPFLAIQQCLYDISKLTVSDTSYGKHPATFIACGALSGAVAQTVVHPLEVVRRLQQIEKSPATNNSMSLKKIKQSSYQVLKNIWRNGGVTRLYAGVTAGYLKVMPSAAISLLVRDSLLGRLKDES